jgi:hypothetical protein
MSKNDTRTINIQTCERGGSIEMIGGMWRCQHSHKLTDDGGVLLEGLGDDLGYTLGV